MDLGLLSSAVIVYLEARRRGLDPMRMLDAALTASVGGLIGARAVYVSAHWDYYRNYVHRAVRLWGGGLAWHGGLVGGLIAVLAYCAWQRRLRALRRSIPSRQVSPQTALDILTPGAAALAIWAWLGCLLTGCAYGVETYPGQGALWMLSWELPDLYGLRAPRVAVQLLGAGWSTIVLIAILAAGRRAPARLAGLLFPLWLALYSVGSLGLGFLRADTVPILAGWRADQVADLALTVIGTVVLIAGSIQEREKGAMPA
jgi:prolipoprotein diacylglyceryltransferase